MKLLFLCVLTLTEVAYYCYAHNIHDGETGYDIVKKLPCLDELCLALCEWEGVAGGKCNDHQDCVCRGPRYLLPMRMEYGSKSHGKLPCVETFCKGLCKWVGWDTGSCSTHQSCSCRNSNGTKRKPISKDMAGGRIVRRELPRCDDTVCTRMCKLEGWNGGQCQLGPGCICRTSWDPEDP